MPQTQFDRDAKAKWYSKEHLKTDPGVLVIYYLPKNAPEREIRLVEVNAMIGDRRDESLDPVDFGVDRGTDEAHKLLVLDVTPDQWKRIEGGALKLPKGWSRDSAVRYAQRQR